MKQNALPPKKLALFGATGTIGDNTLAIIRQHPDIFHLSILTAGHNAEKLITLAREFTPDIVVISDTEQYIFVRDALPPSIRVMAGETGLCEAASSDYDCMVMAITGFSALKPTLCAIREGRTIALANKECLVAAGELFMLECRSHKAMLLPIDSEHNGLFQLWQGIGENIPEHVTLTASGGPFHAFSVEQMQHVTPQQAVAHPNWTMGAKISVDSATLMNKGLELIEAQHLFALSSSSLRTVIHPQSIIHCIIGFADGSQLAQLSLPDMRTPIAYALHYPHRLTVDIPKLSLADIGTLHFESVDTARFPCLQLAGDAMVAGGSAPATLNAANEVVVAAFLAGRIEFTDIARVIAEVMARASHHPITHFDEVYEVDNISRDATEMLIKHYS